MTKKIVGVLAASTKSFQDWGLRLSYTINRRDRVDTPDAIFLYLSRAEAMRGMSFDEVLLLPGFMENRNFMDILNHIPLNMRLPKLELT